MNFIEKKSYAKINIALDVLNKRPDGYHNMKMIMQTINIFDIIKIQKTDTGNINIKSSKQITDDIQNNLIYKACMAVIEYADVDNEIGLNIEIEKIIPMGAGMAGGSANCATTILILNELLDLNLSINEMMHIGKNLGSDVPYCLVGGTKLVEGVGDIITDLNAHPNVNIVVVKPIQSVSTKYIFENIKLDEITKRPDIDKMIESIDNADIKEIAQNFCNVFEEVTFKKYEEIEQIKNILKDNGAINALMTGTGSTVFGYFDDEDKAKKCLSVVGKLDNIELCRLTDVKV